MTFYNLKIYDAVNADVQSILADFNINNVYFNHCPCNLSQLDSDITYNVVIDDMHNAAYLTINGVPQAYCVSMFDALKRAIPIDTDYVDCDDVDIYFQGSLLKNIDDMLYNDSFDDDCFNVYFFLQNGRYKYHITYTV